WVHSFADFLGQFGKLLLLTLLGLDALAHGFACGAHGSIMRQFALSQGICLYPTHTRVPLKLRGIGPGFTLTSKPASFRDHIRNVPLSFGRSVQMVTPAGAR